MELLEGRERTLGQALGDFARSVKADNGWVSRLLRLAVLANRQRERRIPRAKSPRMRCALRPSHILQGTVSLGEDGVNWRRVAYGARRGLGFTMAFLEARAANCTGGRTRQRCVDFGNCKRRKRTSGVRRTPQIPGAPLEQLDALSSRNGDKWAGRQCQNENGLFGAQVRTWNFLRTFAGQASM